MLSDEREREERKTVFIAWGGLVIFVVLLVILQIIDKKLVDKTTEPYNKSMDTLIEQEDKLAEQVDLSEEFKPFREYGELGKKTISTSVKMIIISLGFGMAFIVFFMKVFVKLFLEKHIDIRIKVLSVIDLIVFILDYISCISIIF